MRSVLVQLGWVCWCGLQRRAALAAEEAKEGREAVRVQVSETTFESPIDGGSVLWLGRDRSVVLVRTLDGRLHRSADDGKTFTDISPKLENESIRYLSISPADGSTAMAFGRERKHFVSADSGDSWRVLSDNRTVQGFRWHWRNPSWVLFSFISPSCHTGGAGGPCSVELMVTKDLGRSYDLVATHIVQYNWGELQMGQENRIYYTHHRNKTRHQTSLTGWTKTVDFTYTDDFGATSKVALESGNKFVISHGYILVAKPSENSTGRTVNFYVSSDGGGSFGRGLLPRKDREEEAYTILDTSEGAIIMHANHGLGAGNIYISDTAGLRYSQSLQHNVQENGNCGFEKVMNLNGIYVANVYDGKPPPKPGDPRDGTPIHKEKDILGEDDTVAQSDRIRNARLTNRRLLGQGEPGKERRSRRLGASKIRTVISFNMGGSWAYLKAPEIDSRGEKINCRPGNCWLHMHDVTESRPFAPIYSYRNAVGILMGTGNVGKHLSFDPAETNTFVSRDGGLTWLEAHKGIYIYEFGSRGGILVMSHWSEQTKKFIYSQDEGQTWQEQVFSNLSMSVMNVLTEPEAKKAQFVIYGQRDNKGVMYHLDFNTLGNPRCQGIDRPGDSFSDYETWSPSDGSSPSDSCILGRKISYTRRKRTANCFADQTFELPVTRTNCTCTQEDFECDVGYFSKINSHTCKRTDLSGVFDECSQSAVYHVPQYRKVPGDGCQGGWHPDDGIPCPAKTVGRHGSDGRSTAARSSWRLAGLGKALIVGCLVALCAALYRHRGWLQEKARSRFGRTPAKSGGYVTAPSPVSIGGGVAD